MVHHGDLSRQESDVELGAHRGDLIHRRRNVFLVDEPDSELERLDRCRIVEVRLRAGLIQQARPVLVDPGDPLGGDVIADAVAVRLDLLWVKAGIARMLSSFVRRELSGGVQASLPGPGVVRVLTARLVEKILIVQKPGGVDVLWYPHCLPRGSRPFFRPYTSLKAAASPFR